MELRADSEKLGDNQPTIMVTLLGEYFVNRKWFSLCAETWNLAKLSYPIYILNDGSLTMGSQEKLVSMGFIVTPDTDVNEAVNSVLSNYPVIREMRKKSNLFKKIIDTSVFFREKILYVDSDVLFKKRFILPNDPPSLLFCIDDVPGYGGSWQVPLRYPIVNGLNSGFVYFNPNIIDLDYLEYICHNYLIMSKNIWWLEQTCWAILAARIQEKGIFEGRDACVISGLNKRTPDEIKLNKTTYFRRNKSISELENIELLIRDAAVVHFAGPGKRWIEPIYEKIIDNFAEQKVSQLKWQNVENANWKEKLLIGLRMLLKG